MIIYNIFSKVYIIKSNNIFLVNIKKYEIQNKNTKQ